MEPANNKLIVRACLVFTILGVAPLTAAASSYLPLGSGIDHVYRHVPFEIYGTVLETRHTPGDVSVPEPMILSAWQDLSACGTAKKLHFIQHCAWADNVPTGIVVGRITVFYEDESATTCDLIVGHWKLDEKKGSIASDSSGYGRDGVLSGDPLWLPKDGVLHGVLWLDGQDDYVSLPIGSLIDGLTNCTIMTWVNWSGMHSWQRIFDFGSGTEVNMFLTPTSGEGSGSTNPYELRFAITVGGGGAEERIGTFSLLAGWHHVAVTINADDGVGTLYLGGMPVAVNDAMTLTPSDLGATSQNWLGRSQYEWDSYFEGSLDDFRIYDRVLSQGEIQAVMGKP